MLGKRKLCAFDFNQSVDVREDTFGIVACAEYKGAWKSVISHLERIITLLNREFQIEE